MTWLEFKLKVKETTLRMSSEAVPITFLHGETANKPEFEELAAIVTMTYAESAWRTAFERGVRAALVAEALLLPAVPRPLLCREAPPEGDVRAVRAPISAIGNHTRPLLLAQVLPRLAARTRRRRTHRPQARASHLPRAVPRAPRPGGEGAGRRAGTREPLADGAAHRVAGKLRRRTRDQHLAHITEDTDMAKGNEFLLTPGPLPWRVDCMKRNPKSGAVYDAEGRLVYTAPRRGVPEAQKPPRQETKPSPANLEGTR